MEALAGAAKGTGETLGPSLQARQQLLAQQDAQRAREYHDQEMLKIERQRAQDARDLADRQLALSSRIADQTAAHQGVEEGLGQARVSLESLRAASEDANAKATLKARLDESLANKDYQMKELDQRAQEGKLTREAAAKEQADRLAATALAQDKAQKAETDRMVQGHILSLQQHFVTNATTNTTKQQDALAALREKNTQLATAAIVQRDPEALSTPEGMAKIKRAAMGLNAISDNGLNALASGSLPKVDHEALGSALNAYTEELGKGAKADSNKLQSLGDTIQQLSGGADKSKSILQQDNTEPEKGTEDHDIWERKQAASSQLKIADIQKKIAEDSAQKESAKAAELRLPDGWSVAAYQKATAALQQSPDTDLKTLLKTKDGLRYLNQNGMAATIIGDKPVSLKPPSSFPENERAEVAAFNEWAGSHTDEVTNLYRRFASEAGAGKFDINQLQRRVVDSLKLRYGDPHENMREYYDVMKSP